MSHLAVVVLLELAVYNFGTDLFNYRASADNYDVQNIGESGLEKPLTLSKNGITVTLNQCIFSNSEAFIDYTVNANNAKKKMQREKMGTCHEIYFGDKDVTEKLFKKWLCGEGKSNYWDQKSENIEDKNTFEEIWIHNGDEFKYEGKTLKIVITVVEGRIYSKRTDFEYEINVNKLYPEKK